MTASSCVQPKVLWPVLTTKPFADASCVYAEVEFWLHVTPYVTIQVSDQQDTLQATGVLYADNSSSMLEPTFQGPCMVSYETV
jgi:hypothetical protein